jgi:membrane-associated protease RseP (regulator of RpoE activity)
VRVGLEPLGDDTTHITLTHSGLGPGDDWGEASFQDKQGWESALENLQSVLETGIDLRISRRPMFGLSGANNLDEKLAAKLGVPGTEGLAIDSLVDGLGAQKAGIQKGDVIVVFGGEPITDFASFGRAIQNYRAGDNVEIGFYRGSERRNLTMQLSERPAPDVPSSSEALAERARATFAEVDAELEAALEGVTEEQAWYHTAPDEWSIKEVLAHLITGEQGNQSWIYAVVDDTDTNAPFYSNELGRVRAVAMVDSTIPALLAQLKRAQAITVAQVKAMPAEAQAHKHQYNLLAGWLTTFQTHFREHIAEISALARVAKGRTDLD